MGLKLYTVDVTYHVFFEYHGNNGELYKGEVPQPRRYTEYHVAARRGIVEEIVAEQGREAESFEIHSICCQDLKSVTLNMDVST